MAREPIPTWFFALVVVRRDDQFLIVQERSHGQLWYLPAGRVEQGESLIKAAERETREESGVPVRIDGILRVEHTPRSNGTRVRVFFSAVPIDDTPPKTVADSESLGAVWVRLDELDRYPLRGEEVREVFHYLAKGGSVFPLSLLQEEGSSFG